MNRIFNLIWFLCILYSGCNSRASHDPTLDNTSQIVPDAQEVPMERFPVMISKDFGKTWNDASYNLPTNVQGSFIEKLGDEIVLATDNFGLFVSRDSKTVWNDISQGLPGRKINALHISENTIYAGVYKMGIFKSTDVGKSWIPMNDGLNDLAVQAIWESNDYFLLGTDSGLYTRNKDSNEWSQSIVDSQVVSIYVYNEMWVVGTSRGSAVSKDNGSTWNWIHEQGAVHYTHNIGSRIIELQLNGDLQFSDDLGLSWHNAQYSPRDGSYVYEIVQTGKYLVMSNNYGIHRSTDNGVTWQLDLSTEDIGFFDFLEDGETLYAATRDWDEYRGR